MRGFTVPGLFADQLEQTLLEHAGTTRDQIHRNAHACMHIANDALVGDQLLDIAVIGLQQVAHPALHGRLQPYPHLIV